MTSHPQRILIAGSGAVGSYYGGRLALAGHAVSFWARGAHLDALRAQGLSVQSPDGDFLLRPVIALSAPPAQAQDVIVLAVKAWQTKEVLPQLGPSVGPQTQIVSLQNGVDNEEAIAACYGAEHTIGGVAFIGAERIQPGEVRHSAAGHVRLGAWSEANKKHAGEIVDTWRAAGIRAQLSSDIRTDLWRKLMWNAAFNAATFLAGTGAAELLATPDGERLIRRVMAEVRAVARAEGIEIPADAEDEHIRVTRGTGPIKTSMLADRDHGRAIEFDAITGTVLRRARTRAVSVPVHEIFATLLAAWQRSVGVK